MAEMTFNAFLKPSARASACPEVDRCQLELVEKSEADSPSLVLDDGPGGSRVMNVFLKEKGAGCDYVLNAGLISASAVIAVGYGSGALWERNLISCVASAPLFLQHQPAHMLNIRYKGAGYHVSLVVYQDDGGDYHVIVEREGVVAYRKTFTQNSDSLFVSAALSEDLQTLYIVATRRLSQTYRRGQFFKVVYNNFDDLWQDSISGYVPWVTGFGAAFNYYVDRSGEVSGQLEQHWQDDNSSSSVGGYCASSSSGRIEQQAGWLVTEDNSYVYEIETGVNRVGAGIQPIGASFVSGDVAFVERRLIDNEYDWTYELYEHDHTTSSGYDHYEYRVNNFIPLSVTFGGTDYGIDQNGGVREIHTGHTTDNYTAIPPTGFEYSWSFVMTYSYFAGSRGTTVTAGGWICQSEVGTTGYLDTDMSGSGEQAGDEGLYQRMCFDWDSVRNSNRVTDTVSSKNILYPVDLGGYHSIVGSFYAYDQESGQSYSGIRYAEFDGGATTWRVFKNGAEITASLPACLGHPLDELGAVYWRAGNG